LNIGWLASCTGCVVGNPEVILRPIPHSLSSNFPQNGVSSTSPSDQLAPTFLANFLRIQDGRNASTPLGYPYPRTMKRLGGCQPRNSPLNARGRRAAALVWDLRLAMDDIESAGPYFWGITALR
jgi:hypothetical protein